MRRWQSILVALALVLGLYVCNDSAQAANDTQEKVYAHGEKQLLVSKTVQGQALPSAYNPGSGRVFDVVTEYTYDDFGEMKEEKESLVYPNDMDRVFTDGKSGEFENYTYVYDDEGNVESVTTTVNSTYNGTIQTQDRYLFEGGHLVQQQDVVTSSGMVSEETHYIYGSNGQVTRQERFIYADLLYNEWYPTPIVYTHEFDNDGYCTRWAETSNGNESAMEYSFDNDKNLIRTAHSVNGNIDDLYEIAYENGVQTSLTRSKDGETVVYVFSYDEEGRPASISYDVNGDHVEILCSYNENGYIAEADWVQNGSSIGKTTYTFTEEEDGDVEGTINGDLGPFVFGGNRTRASFYNSYYWDVGPSLIYEYTLKPVLNSIQYVKTTTDYEYDNVSIQIEVDPSSLRTGVAAGEYYPKLQESYGGIPVPVPDGTQRLTRVTLNDYNRLPVVAEFSYDASGNLVGVTSYFDSVGAYEMFKWSEEVEADEQGRVIKRVVSGGSFTYIYGDDSTRYTYISQFGDNEPYQREVSLLDWQIPELVRQTPEEIVPYATFEYNDDGLPIYSTAELKYGDGETETRENRYTYSYETWPDGSLKNLLRQDNDDTYNHYVFSFDEHGYLTDYYCYYNPTPSMPFSYEYEPIG